MKDKDIEKYRPLLMGLMDGELSPEEAAEVNEALTRSAALRDEYEMILASAGKLESLSMVEPADEIARRIWRSPYHRLARKDICLIQINSQHYAFNFFNKHKREPRTIRNPPSCSDVLSSESCIYQIFV